MTTAWNYWTELIAKHLSKQLGTTIEPSEIVTPPDQKLGDFAFGVFRLAKEQKRSPAELAQEIAEKMVPGTVPGTESVTAAGPYVNFTLATGDVVQRVIEEVEKEGETYGKSNSQKNKQLLLEYNQPNTHKENHIGHLRNQVLGAALGKLLTSVGWDVVYMTYHGDVGAHVAKCLWYLVTHHASRNAHQLTEKEVDQILNEIPVADRTGRFLGHIYAASTKALEDKPEFKDDISWVQQKLEAHDPIWEKLWKETRRWCLDEMDVFFDEIGLRVDRQYLESEVVDRGQEIVDSLLKKGVAKESQGAIVVDLEEVKLGIFLVRKSDGTSLYATKDLALAELKAKEYPKYARSLYVVDNRQSFYFKQLFETLHRMGFDKPIEFVGYELVTLKDGAMSSRKGNIVTYEAFRDAVLDYARTEILKRHEDWSEGQVTHTAWALAMAGIKFSMLKQDNDRVFTFDLEQALSFDGATGPYCQYAGVRLGSILKKAKVLSQKTKVTDEFDHQSEKNLALIMAAFPLKVELAAKEMRPSIIAQYTLELAQRVNEFYRDVPVLESKDELLDGRLRLAAVAKQVLAQALAILGIPMPDQM